MHARLGGILEVMGMLVGKIDGEKMIVMDSLALPVEGISMEFSVLSRFCFLGERLKFSEGLLTKNFLPYSFL
jgi:hypothetical protein